MTRSEAIKLLESEGWTKADAIRALEEIDFNTHPDELAIRRSVSQFAGSELSKRQRLQAAQKGMVTKKAKEIEQKNLENNTLGSKVEILVGVNEQLKKDNKDLKNLVDAIKLKLAKDTKKLLQYEDSEIRKALIQLFKWTLG